MRVRKKKSQNVLGYSFQNYQIDGNEKFCYAINTYKSKRNKNLQIKEK